MTKLNSIEQPRILVKQAQGEPALKKLQINMVHGFGQDAPKTVAVCGVENQEVKVLEDGMKEIAIDFYSGAPIEVQMWMNFMYIFGQSNTFIPMFSITKDDTISVDVNTGMYSLKVIDDSNIIVEDEFEDIMDGDWYTFTFNEEDLEYRPEEKIYLTYEDGKFSGFLIWDKEKSAVSEDSKVVVLKDNVSIEV